MSKLYGGFLVPYQKAIVLLVFAVLLLPFLGLSKIEFSTDYRKFFGGNDVHIKAFDDMQSIYAKNDNILIAIEPKEKKVFDKNILKIIEKATDAAWKVPYTTRVDSITNFQNSFSNKDELVVEKLVPNAFFLNSMIISGIKNIAMDETALVNRLVSEQGHVTGINLTVRLPEENINQEMSKIVSKVRELAQEINEEEEIKGVYLSGTVMINNAFFEVALQDLKSLIPIMMLLIVVGLVFLSKSLIGTLTTFSIIGFSIAFAFGLGGWLGIELTPPSASAAPIIMTLSIAACVHVLMGYSKACHNNENTQQALYTSLSSNFVPITLTSITTVIGFLTMNFAESPPFHDLGNLVALGIIAAYFLTMIFLPAVLLIIPHKKPAYIQWEEYTLSKLADFVINNRSLALWGMIILVVGIVAFIPKNELNDEFVKYFDKSVTFRTDNDFITENLTGVYQIEYSLNAAGENGINQPEYLQKVEDFYNWFEQQDYVWHVQSITDVYKKANKNLHGGDEAFDKIPESKELAAQSLLIYEMSLPIGLDLNDQINVDKSATKFIVSLHTISSKELIKLEKKAEKWLLDNAPDYMQAIGTGPAVLFSHIGDRSIKTGLLGGIAALTLISLIMVLVFRSFKVGLISMVPNLIPAAMAFGLWAILNGQINMALATVISMTLGIVVDDSIHFISRYLRGRRQEKLGPEAAVEYAFSHVGLAITITTIVLIIGFMVLTVSPFVMNWGMGLLSAITIAFALITDLILLPALLITIERNPNEETAAISVNV